ncbi:hypothetical protein [Criblamydia sequanensis]|uniref:Membrane protein n=1 Tax=Candidatus Criblamydia sequanensis CRIB-18 TaxID=1437425 RepID=A0A090D2P2_9BACT|nr:hypothetical protein [Criblamydia sequanensis]CDR34548.1 putative membrane protein [Criblamydia sequanensis CRIB-18]
MFGNGHVIPGSRSGRGTPVYVPDERPARPVHVSPVFVSSRPYSPPPVSYYDSTYPLSGRTTYIHSSSGGPFLILGLIAAIFLFTILFPLMLL